MLSWYANTYSTAKLYVFALPTRSHDSPCQIDPKRAIPRQEHQRATKLFIGGLPGSVTSETMREFFSQFGKVIDSTVMLDRETGRSKGFGFVSFENTDVSSFLGFGNLEIDGKLVSGKYIFLVS
jgi:RNA-binding protein Musashi